ncbi:hypothetical protein GCM10023238_23740 [Streptomyces heliomycini]
MVRLQKIWTSNVWYGRVEVTRGGGAPGAPPPGYCLPAARRRDRFGGPTVHEFHRHGLAALRGA